MRAPLLLSSEDAWLAARKEVVTATQITSLLGLNPFLSAAKMWTEKQHSTFTGNSYTTVGQILEPAIIEASNIFLNKEFKRCGNGTKEFYLHPKARLGATPDAKNSADEILECKSMKHIKYVKCSYNPPEMYLAQLAVQLLCMDCQVGYLACMSTRLSPTSFTSVFPLHIFKFKRSEEIDQLIINQTNKFWETIKADKLFRVEKKLKHTVGFLLKFQTEKVM